MPKDEETFQVIDRRSSSAQAEKPPADQTEERPQPEKTAASHGKSAGVSDGRGEGFVMVGGKQEKEETGRSAPHEQVDFSTLILSLATGTVIHLGLSPDPATQAVQKNLPMAKQNIELLALLREKTKGNLTQEESALLENLLTEVRLRYVAATK